LEYAVVFYWTSLWIVLVVDSTGLVEIVVPSFEAVEAVSEFVVAMVLVVVEIVVLVKIVIVEIVVVVQVVVQVSVLVVQVVVVIVVHVLVLVQVVVLVLDEVHCYYCYYYYSLDAVVVDLEIAKC
jgi:hypothetical protein